MNAKVTAIKQDAAGVTVAFEDRRSGRTERRAPIGACARFR
jgi:hypothetical protein